MREFVKVSQTLWRSRKFKSLGEQSRLAYLYILTCPHSTSAGCFDLHPLYACADLGWQPIQFANCMDTLCSVGLVDWDGEENTVFIDNWMEFNSPANPKHAMGIIGQLAQVASHRLKLKAFQLLKQEIVERKFDRDAAVRNCLSDFLIRFGNGIPTETKTERETRLDQDQTRPDLEAPARAAERGGLSDESGNVSPLLKTSFINRGVA
jgi:hypothetical protein